MLNHPRLVETNYNGTQGLATITPTYVDALLNSGVSPCQLYSPSHPLYPPPSINDGDGLLCDNSMELLLVLSNYFMNSI